MVNVQSLSPDLPEKSSAGQPVWQLALLFPTQGSWTEDDYWALEGGRLVEFEQGHVEIHEVPTREHQRIVLFLYRLMFEYVTAHWNGEVLTAPMPVRLWDEKYREPDVLIVSSARSEYRGYPDGADLVVEVVSENNASRRRDLEAKPIDYAKAGVTEYWIVDPSNATIRVGVLQDHIYEWTAYTRGQNAASSLLPGLFVSVDETFDAGGGKK